MRAFVTKMGFQEELDFDMMVEVLTVLNTNFTDFVSPSIDMARGKEPARELPAEWLQAPAPPSVP